MSDGNIGWIKGGYRAATAIAGIDTTGTVDNTATINNAITAAAAGSVLTLPQGTKNIRCDGGILIGVNNVTLVGLGTGAGIFTAGSAASLVPTGTKTSNYTAAVNDSVVTDGAFTVTMPAAPVDGSVVQVNNFTFAAGNITVAAGAGDTIQHAASVLIPGVYKTWVYSSSAKNWSLFGTESRVSFGNANGCVVKNIIFTGSNAMHDNGGDHPGGYAQLTTQYATEKGCFWAGSTQCATIDCSFVNCGGSGHTLGDDSLGEAMNFSCVVLRNTVTHCGGNGLDNQRVNGLLIDGLTTSLVGQEGIDWEPNNPSDPNELISDVEVRNCNFDAWILVLSAHGGGNHPMSRVWIHNNTFTSAQRTASGGWPVFNQNSGLTTTPAGSDWVIENNSFASTFTGGPNLVFWNIAYVTNVAVRNNVSTGTSGITVSGGANNYLVVVGCSGRIECSGNTIGTGQISGNPLVDGGGNTPTYGVMAQNGNVVAGSTYTPQVFFPANS